MLISRFIDTIKGKIDFNSVKTILDVGSRDLEQSLEFRSIFPNAKIYAFEANPESYQAFQPKLTDNIQAFQFAAMNYDGEIRFTKVSQDENTGASSIFEPTENMVGTPAYSLDYINVPCRRLDTWAKENGITSVDLIWADVQGAELPMFEGMGDLLNTVQAIATEAETGKLYFPSRKYQPTQYQELKTFLESKGFEEWDYVQPWPLECDVVYGRKK